MRLSSRILFFILLVHGATSSLADFPKRNLEGQMIPTLSPIIKKSLPAVVNIATTSAQKMNHPLFSNPFFREYYNIPPGYQIPEQKTQSAGSGVIIDSKKGIVVTNFHVVKGADNIDVILHDGEQLKATLVGSDPEVDIAVLQVSLKDKSQIALGNSDLLKVGDFVIAMGNPFGLNQTVTKGIVSALGRSGLGIEGYEDFIQTDASINPGNSGGALINLKGQLIGINTAIIAPAKGNVGIGFAIPINMAMYSVNQILQYGEVKRGRIGVAIQDITVDLANAFNLKNRKGALVSSVLKQSPAESAGIEAGDVITAVDGDFVDSVSQLRNAIAAKPIDKSIKITLIRKGKEKIIRVKVVAQQRYFKTVPQVKEGKSAIEGVKLVENNGQKGLKVTHIEPDSQALQAGLNVGDIILSVNQIETNQLSTFNKIVKSKPEKLLMQIKRDQAFFYLVIK